MNTSGLFFIHWNNAFYDVLSDFESTLDSKESRLMELSCEPVSFTGEKRICQRDAASYRGRAFLPCFRLFLPDLHVTYHRGRRSGALQYDPPAVQHCLCRYAPAPSRRHCPSTCGRQPGERTGLFLNAAWLPVI